MTSVTEELNFVKVDYSRFKNMPRSESDPFWGIEEGKEEPRRVAAKKNAEFCYANKTPKIFEEETSRISTGRSQKII